MCLIEQDHVLTSQTHLVFSVSVGSDHDVRICVLSFLIEMAESFQVFVTGFLPVFVSKLSDQVNTRTHCAYYY